MSDSPVEPRDAPWFLEPGPEECAHCGRSHHAEVSVRCVACDQPVCPFCIVTVRRVEFCPACRTEEPD